MTTPSDRPQEPVAHAPETEAAEEALSIARVQYPALLLAARAQRRAAEAGFALARASNRRQHRVNPRATTKESIDAADSQQRVRPPPMLQALKPRSKSPAQ